MRSELLDRLRYAFLLASPADKRVVPIIEVVRTITPLDIGDITYLGDGTRITPTPEATITVEVAECIIRWAARVNAEHPKSLDIGMRRLLSAAGKRTDPMDGFIDAVMCWENLFGGAQDTTMKVCGAMAKLLEPDDHLKREKLFAHLTKLYDARSKLVHGAGEPSSAKAYEHRDQALDLAVRAMRAAYEVEGFFLLKDSVERHKRLLLGFPIRT